MGEFWLEHGECLEKRGESVKMRKTVSMVYEWGVNRYLQVQQVVGLLGIINFFMIFYLAFGISDPLLIGAAILGIGVGAYVLDGRMDFRGKTFGSHSKKNPWARDVTRRLVGIEKTLKKERGDVTDRLKRIEEVMNGKKT